MEVRPHAILETNEVWWEMYTRRCPLYHGAARALTEAEGDLAGAGGAMGLGAILHQVS